LLAIAYHRGEDEFVERMLREMGMRSWLEKAEAELERCHAARVLDSRSSPSE
jgi:hypothetical protein